MKETPSDFKMSDKDKIAQQFPNPGQIANGQVTKMNPDNFYAKRDIEDVRVRFMDFSVLMKHVMNTLELDRHASVDQLSIRIRDLVIAAHQDEHIIPSKEELENPDPDI